MACSPATPDSFDPAARLRRWWGGKIRQTVRYLRARVSAAEHAALAAWLTPAQLSLFDSMDPADQRHGLDVVRSLREQGRDDRDLLMAGLFHDAGKGRTTGVGHRVAWALGERYGSSVWRLAARIPGYAAALERMRRHAERSAELALQAGCSPLTADLILQRVEPRTAPMVDALRLADEAN